MTSTDRRYVVATCHDGTDWCIRDATPAEMAEDDGWLMTYEDARETAAKHGRFYDFSTGGATT